MNEHDDNFRQSLITAFRTESEEYLREMTTDILHLESLTDRTMRDAVVEKVFRLAHNLKGAARAVGFAQIERLCQALEEVLSAIKTGAIDLVAEHVDLLLRGLDHVGELVAAPEGTGDVSILAALVLDLDSLTGPLHPELRKTGPDSPQPAPVPGGPTGQSAPSARPVGNGRNGGKAPREHRPDEPETIRIAAGKLEQLLGVVDEIASLKMSSARRAQGARQLLDDFRDFRRLSQRIFSEIASSRDNPSASDTESFNISEALGELGDKLRRLEGETQALAVLAASQHRILASRIDTLAHDSRQLLMRPFSSILDVIPRMSREIARSMGKQIELKVRGGRIETDRRILEALKDPLIHLVRNSLDHGIESPEERLRIGKPERGFLSIQVSQSANGRIRLQVVDDGSGIDPDAVRRAATAKGKITSEEAEVLSDAAALDLVFQSEVSTSRTVTAISGRGLGLAIVREAVEGLGGSVSLESKPGRSTIFTMHLPPSLAAFRAVIVRVGDMQLAIPSAATELVRTFRPEALIPAGGGFSINYSSRLLPVMSLRAILSLPTHGDVDKAGVILILSYGNRQAALLADEVLAEREVLLKQLPWPLERVSNVAGVSTLPNGDVVVVLNPVDLIRAAIGGRLSPETKAKNEPEERPKTILLAEDSVTSRMLLKNVLNVAGYAVDIAVDGQDALKALEARDYDMLVTDIEMPRMNGFDLTARIRSDERLAELPVVLVTSLGSSADRERGIDVGANAYIVKSGFDQNKLLDVVRRLI